MTTNPAQYRIRQAMPEIAGIQTEGGPPWKTWNFDKLLPTQSGTYYREQS